MINLRILNTLIKVWLTWHLLLLFPFNCFFFSFKLKFSIVEFSPVYVYKHEYANPTTNIQLSLMKCHYINVFKLRLFYSVNLVELLSTSRIISENQSLFHVGMSTKACQSPHFSDQALGKTIKMFSGEIFAFFLSLCSTHKYLLAFTIAFFPLWVFKIGFLRIYAYRFRTTVWKIGFICLYSAENT